MECDNVKDVLHGRERLVGKSVHLDAVIAKVEEMQRRGQADIGDVLREINESNVAFVPGARYAGITAIDRAGTVTTLGATGPYAQQLDEVQRETGEGPCLSAAWTQHTIHIEDLTADDRWPRFRQAALANTPVRSVLSFRLLDDEEVAALNFLAESPGVFDEESTELGLLAAAHTMVAWNMVNRERQFRSALASRDVIGQAKGILMERFDIDAVAAFELLRRLSQESNVRVAELAARLANTERRRG